MFVRTPQAFFSTSVFGAAGTLAGSGAALNVSLREPVQSSGSFAKAHDRIAIYQQSAAPNLPNGTVWTSAGGQSYKFVETPNASIEGDICRVPVVRV
jgi:hypothetical protein